MKIPRRFIIRIIVVSFVVLLVSMLIVGIAAANGPLVVAGSMSKHGCAIYYNLTVQPNDYDQYVVLGENDNGLFLVDEFFFTGPGTYDISGKFWVGPKYNGRLIELWYTDGGTKWEQIDTLVFNCSGEEHQYWWFSVADMGASTNYSYMGELACGVFDVQGHGAKTVDLSSYPNCEGEVSVMCLDGEGNWTAATVHDFTQVGTVVQWTSGQHGTCAFFAK